MNEDLTRQLLRRIAALERRLGIVETSEAGAAHSHAYSDHGNLTGLADDDHTQYLLAAGTRALTADWDIGDGRKLIADVVRARDAAGLSLQDDGANEALKVNDGGTMTFTGAVANRLAARSFYTAYTSTINDDAALALSDVPSRGIIILYTGTLTNETAMVIYRAEATSLTQLLINGGVAEVTTGALTGTTGTDGRFTVSAHTDGKVYIENRRGGTRGWHYIIMGP